MTIRVDGTTGISGVDGSASLPSYVGVDTNTGIFFPAADTIAFVEGGTEAARIDSSGRLLVGTSTSRSVSGLNARLHVEGITAADSTLTITSNGTTPHFGFSRTGSAAIGSNALVANNDLCGRIYISGTDGTNAIPLAYIDGAVDGDVGVNSMPGRIVFYTTASGASTPTERMRIASDGRISAGSSTAYGRIHASESGISAGPTIVNGAWTKASFVASGGFGGAISFIDGSAGYSIWVEDSGNDLLIAQGSTTGTLAGGVYINNAAGSWSARSDERDKVNLEPIENGLDKIKTLRAVIGSYSWAQETRHPFLIAQDVQAVLPEAVNIANKNAPEDEQRLGMSYTDMIPLLVQALKESAQKIETLEAKVAALEATP